jgi:hypothetical protein
MKTAATGDTVKTITAHYIDGSFVESHGREVMSVIKPTNGQVIARVTLGDEEDSPWGSSTVLVGRARKSAGRLQGCVHTAV